ncbi:MAG: hypothetical protein R3Y23_05370 [Bacillota bacterium]
MRKSAKLFIFIMILATFCCSFVACNTIEEEESSSNSDTSYTQPEVGAKYITLMLINADGEVKLEISCNTNADTLEDFLTETSEDTFGYITFETTTIDEEEVLIGFTINGTSYGGGDPLDVFTSCLDTEVVSENDILDINKGEYYMCTVSYSELVIVDYETYIIRA